MRRLTPGIWATVALLSALAGSPARGQFDIMFPWPMQNQQSPGDFLNDRALQNAATARTAQQGGGSGGVQLNSGNMYWNNLRDPAFVERYGAADRAPLSRRTTTPLNRAPAVAAAATPAARPAAAQPSTAATSIMAPAIVLDAYFDSMGRFRWPADAEIAEDLASKRQRAEAEVVAALREWQASRVTRLQTATTARQALLEFGQPTLQRLRETTSSQVAETFHVFLLGLYNGLEQATIPPPPPVR
ncbi:hypothetical protein EP7_001548 [Isosphaeraceae bacterium EP7]